MFDPSWEPYNRYNARRSTPAQVARDFIPPDHYATLRDTIDPQLVVGPRGIGKTTLLKMLLPEAIDAWKSPEAESARQRIGFTGVFVAADKMWAGQFDQLAEPLRGDPLRVEARQIFARAAFAYMALSSFAATAAYRCRPDGDTSSFRWVKMGTAEEERLAALIAPSWLAHPATSTFSGLSEQMQDRLAALGQLMVTAGLPGVKTTDLRRLLRTRMLRIDFFTAAVRFIDAFNRAVGEQEEPWVLLIDEFEFLPPGAQSLLGAGFQGRDPRLSYKVSLAPYTGLKPFRGSDLDDWDQIQLLPPQNPADDRFTRELLKRQLESGDRPERLLRGRGFESGGKNSFRPRSKNATEIAKLAALDAGFEQWLKRTLKGLSIEEAAESRKLRKLLTRAMPLVRLRLEYHKAQDRRQAEPQTGQPVSTLYCGLRNIYAISEGNPRWIKALAHALRAHRGRGAQTITPTAQSHAIGEVAYKLYNKLKAVNIETSSGGGATTPYTDYGELTPSLLLDALGAYLKAQTHERKFSPDLPGAFENDLEDDEWLSEIVNSLVFLGALIVEKRGLGREHDVLRPARMWAPIFHILPRGGATRSLDKALSHPSAKRHVRRSRSRRKTETEGEAP